VGITLSGCTVTGNGTGNGGDTWNEGGHGGNGGGIHCSTATIDGCTIAGNKTGWGGWAPGSSPGPLSRNNRSAVAGNGGAGAGLYCENATIDSTVIGNNETGYGGFSEWTSGLGGDGGGIYCTAWDLRLSGCTVDGNLTGDGGNGYEASGHGGKGAGICAPFSSPLDIIESTISGNTTGRGGNGDGVYGGSGVGSGGNGGGILCDTLTLTNSTLAGNRTGDGGDVELTLQAGNGGSGGAVHAASATMTGCAILDNRTGAGGDCEDSGSSAGHGGSGAGIWAGAAVLDGCMVCGNSTGPGGAVIYGGDSAGSGGSGAGLFTDSGAVTNCTFSNNTAGNGGSCQNAPGGGGHGGGGAGIRCVTGTIVNCLVVHNSSGDGGDCNQSGGDAGNGGSGAGIEGTFETLSSCTVCDNSAGAGGIAINAGSDGLDGTGGGSLSTDMTVNDSILWGNQPDQIDGSNLSVHYSDVQDGWGESWFDPTTCLDNDPLFDTTFPGGAYFLSHVETGHAANSPCIDLGDPNSPMVTGTTRIDGEQDKDRLDMGYHYPPVKILNVPETYATIQGAIDAAADRDVVLVSPGTYFENIDFTGKAISVRSSRGAALTRIDGQRADSVVRFATKETSLSALVGFTITNGDGTAAQPGGGGITCDGASPVIAQNVIELNHAGGGGGIFCSNGAAPIIVCNFIRANTCELDGGGGVYCAGSSPIITNNTIVDNDSLGHGGGIRCNDSRPAVTNCIVRRNLPEQIDGPDAVAAYCNVEGGRPGPGNIDFDPKFVDASAGDIHILFGSPCLNRGLNTAPHLPNVDFEGDPRVADGTVDMGADEFHLHLYFAGDLAPGAEVDLRVVGLPGLEPVLAIVGTELHDPPLSTPYGDLFLKAPFSAHWNMGKIDGNGLLIHPFVVPLEVTPGKEYHFQSLAGELNEPSTALTNLMTLGIFD